MSARLIPPRPRLPITISPVPMSSAKSTISAAAAPTLDELPRPHPLSSVSSPPLHRGAYELAALARAPAPLGEERVAARIDVGVSWLLDENNMQFGAGAVSQLESGCSGELGILGAVGCQKHGRGEDAHSLHLL